MRSRLLSWILIGIATLPATRSFAAGYDKAILWSGKYGGVANNTASNIHGAESLAFNPAGLASGRTGFEFVGDFSPTWVDLSGPLPNFNTLASGTLTGPQESTGFGFVPLFAAMASYGITPQWGVGVGVYVGAGDSASYSPTDILPSTFPSTIKTDFYDTEVSIGTGYEILPGLRIGGAYRILMTKAAFGSVVYNPSSSSVSNVNIENLSRTRWNGFRFGAQYVASDNSWGVGATIRTGVDATLNGNATITTGSALGTLPATTGAASVTSGVPTMITAGANYLFLPALRGFLEYDWTQYHSEAFLGTFIAGQTPSGTVLGWNNQNDLRLALEYTGLTNMALRAGYVFTTQVTPNTNALPTEAAPNIGNTIVVGAGTQFLNQSLDLDGAIEYAWDSGAGVSNPPFVAGNYSAKAISLHLGVTYRI